MPEASSFVKAFSPSRYQVNLRWEITVGYTWVLVSHVYAGNAEDMIKGFSPLLLCCAVVAVAIVSCKDSVYNLPGLQTFSPGNRVVEFNRLTCVSEEGECLCRTGTRYRNMSVLIPRMLCSVQILPLPYMEVEPFLAPTKVGGSYCTVEAIKSFKMLPLQILRLHYPSNSYIKQH